MSRNTNPSAIEIEGIRDAVGYHAMVLLEDYLRHPEKQRDIESHRAARVASSVLNSYSRMKATESQQEAIRVMIARESSSENGATFKAHLEGKPLRRLAGRTR